MGKPYPLFLTSSYPALILIFSEERYQSPKTPMSLQQSYTPKRPIAPTAVLLTLFFVPQIVFADWVVHKHLPRWAQRGAMRACVAPFDAHKLRPWIDADPLACKFNLLFTGQTAWEDARTPAEQILKHCF